MRKDPTEFKQRFEAYKNGKSVKEIYDAGYIKEPVITPDPLYNEYINSLPDNQRLTPESLYRSHRYWELNDKPKNFGEAIGRGMFTYDFTDNGWHANSVALNKKTGEYEFMKPNWHSTKMYEDAWYYSKDGADFRSGYTKKPGVAYDKYIPKHCNGKLPKYEDGKGKSILKILTSPFLFLRDHMYKTVSPSGYTTEQISNFIKGKKRTRFQDPNTEAIYGLYTKQDSVNTQLYEDFLKNNNIPYKIVGKDEYGDPILRVAVKDIIKPSVYKKDAYEFRYPNLPGQYPLVPKGTVGDKKWVHSHMLGGYHKGTQKDETGTYDYYEDKWDINPFKGQSANDDGSTLFKAGNKIGLGYFDNIVPWGNPIDVYGRVYQKQK